MDKRARRSTISDLVRPAARLASLTPPLQVRGAKKLYVVGGIDAAKVQPFLPAGLRVSSTATGVMSAFTVADSPVGPWECAVLGVAVADHDSPDGMEGVYWTGTYADANGQRLMRAYDAETRPGVVRLYQDGDTFSAEMWEIDGTGHVTFAIRTGAEPEAIYDGAYNYLGADGLGGALKFSIIGHDREVVQGEVTSLEIADDASPAVRSLRPTSLGWGVYHSHIDYIMGVPRSVDVPNSAMAADAHVGLLLATFDNQRRAALILDGAGAVRYRNEAADNTLGAQFRNGGRFVSDLDGDRDAVGRAILLVRDRRSLCERVLLTARGQSAPLMAQITALDDRVAGPGGVMVLLGLQGPIEPGDVAKLLRLLGLTTAEATLAAVVGGGAAPREAAAKLGITEGTARSTLRQVFDKLQVNRQTDLARLVTRLEML